MCTRVRAYSTPKLISVLGFRLQGLRVIGFRVYLENTWGYVAHLGFMLGLAVSAKITQSAQTMLHVLSILSVSPHTQNR